jgi:hypothetical protein
MEWVSGCHYAKDKPCLAFSNMFVTNPFNAETLPNFIEVSTQEREGIVYG